MASVKKFQSKNILKHSVNDAEKLKEKEKISSTLKIFNNNSKEKSNDNNQRKYKKSDILNFFKNQKFNSSNSNSNNKNKNNNINNNFSNSIKNSNNSYLEAKNVKANNFNKNNFTNTFNLNYGSQKLLHDNNNENLNNNSQINNNTSICNNSNFNFSLKNQKELVMSKMKDISIQNINKMLYLSTEPEKSEFNFSDASFNPKGIKVFQNTNSGNQNNTNNYINNSSNSNVASVYNNFLRTNPNNNFKKPNTVYNDNHKYSNTNQLNVNKLKKASFLMNINNHKHLNLSNNISNNYIKNTDMSLNNNINYYNNNNNNNYNNENRNSNSKSNKKIITQNNLNSSNSKTYNSININTNNTNNIPKNPQAPRPIPTYSSTHDFIEDFFKELEKYCSNLNNNNNIDNNNDSNLDNNNNKNNQQNLNLNRLNILNIFDNIFKNIITGEKPMETLDIHIKKKLSNYSEIWKNFLLAYEKISIKANASKNPNPNFINNIDLSTKNVINHNHNINAAAAAGEIGCFNDAFISQKQFVVVQNIKAELEEKFTNLMKTEVNKIKGIVSEKEKIIEELQNEINVKNSCISEMQETLNNLKSKEALTSNRLLFSENFLKENLQENDLSTIKKNFINLNNEINNTDLNFNRENSNSNLNINRKKNNNKTKSNKNLQNIEVSAFSEQSGENAFNIISNNNLIVANINSNSLENQMFEAPADQSKMDQISLYDQKQFIREKHMLLSENKTLFDKLSEMEKLLNFQKEKEVKLMKVLFFLNKQGIPIDEIIQNQLLSEKSELYEHSQIDFEMNFTPLESSKSMDSLMYLPLTLEKPNLYTKPEVIPVLNLRGINSNFNLEYGSAKKSNNSNNIKTKVCNTDPSYYYNDIANKKNNNVNNCNYNNYLIEENYDNDDVELNLDFAKNKKMMNKYKQSNNYLIKNKNNHINNNKTIQNDNENIDYIQMVNKNAIKENLKMNKGLLNKNLQFRNIKNNISPIFFKNEFEKKNQNLTQDTPEKPSINLLSKIKERTNTKDIIANLSYVNYNNNTFNRNIGESKPNNAFWNNYNQKKNNQETVTNHSNFKIISDINQKDKNISINKSLGEMKMNSTQNQDLNLNNKSNNNLDNYSKIYNPVYLNTSYKKNPNKTQFNENISFLKNSSNINITYNSLIKHDNEKLKLNLDFSMKNKMKRILINKQSTSLTKSIESSFNRKNK